MKALIFDGTLALKDIPRPEPQPGEALIRVLKAGICKTDVEICKGYMDFHGVLGHEFVGVVEHSSQPELVGKQSPASQHKGRAKGGLAVTGPGRKHHGAAITLHHRGVQHQEMVGVIHDTPIHAPFQYWQGKRHGQWVKRHLAVIEESNLRANQTPQILRPFHADVKVRHLVFGHQLIAGI